MANVTGTNASNNLNGTNLADEIFGLGGNDILIGFDGDDVLEGGAGADQLFGSPGFDYVSYRSSNTGVEITLEFFEGHGGHAEGDQYFSIEGVIGSAYTDLLFGTEERDVLRGEGGSDYLSAYGGDDVLSGGGGNDVLYAAVGGDEMRGDGGIDFAYYPGPSQAVRVDLAAGKGFGGAAEGDRLFSIEGVYGSYLNDPSRATPRATSSGGAKAPILCRAEAVPTDSSTSRRKAPSRRPTASSISAAARATSWSSARWTPTCRATAINLSSLSARAPSRAPVSCTGSSRTATRSSRATRPIPPRVRS